MSIPPPYAENLEILIAEKIAAGEWKPGEYLPVNRQLAAQYGISEGSVRVAIDRLKAKGVLVGHQGKGVYVAAGRSQED